MYPISTPIIGGREKAMGDTYPKLRVAAVQAAPVFLNREGTVEKSCRLIEEAGSRGARLVGFPEGFIPAHPVWYHFRPATEKGSYRMARELVKNSVEIPGPATEALCAAARRADCCVVMGVCEKRPGTLGTLYNSQLFIDNRGRILGKHQKVMPTLGERLVHTGGFGDTLRAFDTEFGKVSGLICGENSNPLAIFALAAQGTCIHVASWPNHFAPTSPYMGEVVLLSSRSLAYKANCFVLNCCSTISEEMRQILPYQEADRVFLEEAGHDGGSCIVNPHGRVIAGPLGGEEGILYADIDLEDVVQAKLSHDYVGHYNRADIFTLTVRSAVPRLFQRTEAAPFAAPAEVPPVSLPPEGEERGGERPAFQGAE
ncbi:MAG: carbon-nitrogen hydrolase family protein [Candidatus Tectomicrobia bacterium]|nr:carbon-nitrogen hydrolase family protein [Candidatus Tectomicrobia bacterium]